METVKLEVNGINTFYGKSQILRDMSFSVKSGELVGLLGRNGVGKTTTLNSVMGIVPPRSGSISFEGQNILGLPPYGIARRGIGLVPEGREIFPTLTVRENLLMGTKASKKKRESEIAWSVEKVYEYFPALKKLDSNKGGHLSGGEQQMLSIGRTLMGNPRLLLLDEPMEGLAPLIINYLTKMIKQIEETGISVLLVEESMKIILKLCQRVYVMGKGMIVFEGTGSQLMGNDEIRKNYLEV